MNNAQRKTLADEALRRRDSLLAGHEVHGFIVDERFAVQMCVWEISPRTKNLGTLAAGRQVLAVPGIYWGVDVEAHPGGHVSEAEAFALARLLAGRAPTDEERQPPGALASLWFTSANGWSLWQPMLRGDYERAATSAIPL